MVYDFDLIKKLYLDYNNKIKKIKKVISKPLTLTEKILYSHLHKDQQLKEFRRGEDYVNFSPDRVAMQDATAQMALLQFMQSNKETTSVPSSVHCDHLIQAKENSNIDLEKAKETNKEVYDFLSSVSDKYGIGFWKPGAGIIHQVVLENYAFAGGMMVGTDSHTPNAGGLGMIAIGVGGADAVDVMAGLPWELKFPKIIGVKLTGKLNGWTSPKDVILKIAGILTVKGGTGYILEYFGEGVKSFSATGKGTICNMGAEVGATTSIFPYDNSMEKYLNYTNRKNISTLANNIKDILCADKEVYNNPEKYYDKIIEINLSKLEPHINGPFSPDIATPISKMKETLKKKNWSSKVDVSLIGSCTNSSYEDMSRAISIVKQAKNNDIKIKTEFNINPGSEQVRYTMERDGLIKIFKDINANFFANACGPCIGMWNRQNSEKKEKNTIIHSFNRNFSKRNDGNPNTYAFVASPEIVTAIALSGDLGFNPITDTITNDKGEEIKLNPPSGDEFPKKGFEVKDNGYQNPSNNSSLKIIVDKNSERLQLLKPFKPWSGKNLTGIKLLIKVKGKCTTDHISMAGIWLKYRGHLDNISNNFLIGAINYFNEKTNYIINQITKKYDEVPNVQRFYKKNNIDTIVVGEHNYGEGSSREHAAMEPRYLGVRAIIVKSFARIHETNLKKQGMLAFTFVNEDDYDKIKEDDIFNFINLNEFSPNKNILLEIVHSNNEKEIIELSHTYNEQQINWFKKGSALNVIVN